MVEVSCLITSKGSVDDVLLALDVRSVLVNRVIGVLGSVLVQLVGRNAEHVAA